MNIDFTKEEYRLLVDMLHIAQQVINPNLFRGEETKKEYADLIEKIYSNYKEMDAHDVLEKLEDTGKHREKPDIRNSTFHFVMEYNEINFWEELRTKLYFRDSKEMELIPTFNELSQDEQSLIYSKITEKYNLEIENHGINRLRITE